MVPRCRHVFILLWNFVAGLTLPQSRQLGEESFCCHCVMTTTATPPLVPSVLSCFYRRLTDEQKCTWKVDSIRVGFTQSLQFNCGQKKELHLKIHLRKLLSISYSCIPSCKKDVHILYGLWCGRRQISINTTLSFLSKIVCNSNQFKPKYRVLKCGG